MTGSLPKFTMEFEPATIQHLGLKLYVSLPPVIGELVSNSWDADAERVDIILPNGKITQSSEVLVKDNGAGMDAKAVQEAYLRIGRNCREETRRETSPLKNRSLMGRKGLGKLSAFGVATEVEVRTVRKRFGICIRLNYDRMKGWPKGKPYEPELVANRSGPTDDPNGTEVRIADLHRVKPINSDLVRRELARRFTVVGTDFKVFVNGVQITEKDRRLKEDCKKAWNVDQLPKGGVINDKQGWAVSGWIGLVEKSSQTDRGVDVFARGKAVELDTMFGLRTTDIQFARAYVVGEVHADFLDEEEDNIATGRNSVHWESEAGQDLQEWGRDALKWIFEQWLRLQQKEKEERLVQTADFKKWLGTRTPREQRVAKRLIETLVKDPNIEPEAAAPLLEIIKTNIEFEAFQDLVDEIGDSGVNVQTLLKLFEDWRIIEAREHLRLSDGRLEVMGSLSECIRTGALEVKSMQPLFEENGWLVDPSWGNVTGQTRYTKLLRENCKEPKAMDPKDRRIDILGYSISEIVHVVELKKPDKTLSRGDLEQVEKYVDWARSNLLGTGSHSPTYIRGLLIVGRLSKDAGIQSKMRRLAGDDIRVDTYDGLLDKAKKIYGEVEERLRSIAPEYSRQARKGRKKGK